MLSLFRTVFEKSGLPAIEYSTSAEASAILDSSHPWKDQL